MPEHPADEARDFGPALWVRLEIRISGVSEEACEGDVGKADVTEQEAGLGGLPNASGEEEE